MLILWWWYFGRLRLIDVSFTKIAIQFEWALIAFMRFYYTLFTIEFRFLLLDFLYIRLIKPHHMAFNLNAIRDTKYKVVVLNILQTITRMAWNWWNWLQIDTKYINPILVNKMCYLFFIFSPSNNTINSNWDT